MQAAVLGAVGADMFREKYADVFKGDERWRALPAPDRATSTSGSRTPPTSATRRTSTPSRRSRRRCADIVGARVLAVLGDSVTTDHISPAGSIKADSPAGKYLIAHGVKPVGLQLLRGAPRQPRSDDARHVRQHPAAERNWCPASKAASRVHLPDGEQTTIYDAAMRYQQEGVPLVILAGKEYGSGSSRDWAAKGTALLGVKVVDRRELRAHPPQQPRQHGGVAAAVRGGRQRVQPRADRAARRSASPVSATLTPRSTRHRVGEERGGRPAEDLRARWCGSTRPRSSRRSATAASCRTCCASWRSSPPIEPVARGRAGRPCVAITCSRRPCPRTRSSARARAPASTSAASPAPSPSPNSRGLAEWLARGFARRHGTTSRAPRQAPATPAGAAVGTQSVIALGTLYNTDRPYSIETADPTRAGISRYAWGDDYHTVIGAALDLLVARLTEPARRGVRAARLRGHRAGAGTRLRATRGPRVDREERLPDQPGPGLVVLPVGGALQPRPDPDLPEIRPLRHVRAVPGGVPARARRRAGQLDARRCLSYLTIELRGDVPRNTTRRSGPTSSAAISARTSVPTTSSPNVLTTQRGSRAPRSTPSASPPWRRWTTRRCAPDPRRSAMKRTGLVGLRRNLAAAHAPTRTWAAPRRSAAGRASSAGALDASLL